MTAKKDKKQQQPGKADAVEVTGEELSDEEMEGATGGADRGGVAKSSDPSRGDVEGGNDTLNPGLGVPDIIKTK